MTEPIKLTKRSRKQERWKATEAHRPDAERLSRTIQRLISTAITSDRSGHLKTKDGAQPGQFYVRNSKGQVFRIDTREVNPVAFEPNLK